MPSDIGGQAGAITSDEKGEGSDGARHDVHPVLAAWAVVLGVSSAAAACRELGMAAHVAGSAAPSPAALPSTTEKLLALAERARCSSACRICPLSSCTRGPSCSMPASPCQAAGRYCLALLATSPAAAAATFTGSAAAVLSVSIIKLLMPVAPSARPSIDQSASQGTDCRERATETMTCPAAHPAHTMLHLGPQRGGQALFLPDITPCLRLERPGLCPSGCDAVGTAHVLTYIRLHWTR